MLCMSSRPFSSRKAVKGLVSVMPQYAEYRSMPALAAVRWLMFALAGFAIGLLLAATALPLAARAEPPAGTPPAVTPASKQSADNADLAAGKTISIVVYGDDPCPTGKKDEIVVCAREPESERYRIPKRFRGKKEQPAVGNAWNNKVRSTEDASRTAAGLPDTCSAVGSGGQSGCFAKFQTQSRLQRQQDKDDAANNPDGVPQD
jgi:hypothetical protein